MRVIAASILCVATAFRTNTFNAHVQKHENDGKWGLTASCESLQTAFNTRLASIEDTVESMDPANPTLSSGSQARLTMRVYGLGRTLRRAKDCAWVSEAEGTESDNAVRVQSLLTTLFQMNPCSQQAQAEMEAAGEGEEARAAAMQQTMSILTSDTCQATQVETTHAEMASLNDSEEEVPMAAIEEEEALVADRIEEMMNEEGSEGSSFIESSYAVERIVRFLIVIMIFVLLMVLCTWVVVWVAMFIVSYFVMLLGMLGIYVSIAAWQFEQLILPPAMLACGYDLFMRIVNPEIGRLNR